MTVDQKSFRFGSYLFPIAPSRFEIHDRLEIATQAAPLVGQIQQPMGRTARIVSGEGSFFGSRALEDY